MTEKELISKIKGLNGIQPNQDWVFSTKKRILGEEAVETINNHKLSFSDLLMGFRFVLGHKFAFASLTVLFVFIGAFSFVQNSLPGDSLYSIKKFTEKSQAIFSLDGNQSRRNLELANKRLDDLTKIAQSNSVKNLASAINEYKDTVSEAAKSIIEEEPGLGEIEEIVLEARKLRENREKVEALGVVIDDGTSELNQALSQLVEREIKYLENRELTEEQSNILEEAKKAQESEEFFLALEKILYFSNIEKERE